MHKMVRQGLLHLLSHLPLRERSMWDTACWRCDWTVGKFSSLDQALDASRAHRQPPHYGHVVRVARRWWHV